MAIQYEIHPDLEIYLHPLSLFNRDQRGKRLRIFFCPFFIYGGNMEVTFCSLLMDPGRQTSNPVMDVTFSFFLLAPSVMMMEMGHICLNICQQDGTSVRGTLLFNLI